MGNSEVPRKLYMETQWSQNFITILKYCLLFTLFFSHECQWILPKATWNEILSFLWLPKKCVLMCFKNCGYVLFLFLKTGSHYVVLGTFELSTYSSWYQTHDFSVLAFPKWDGMLVPPCPASINFNAASISSPNKHNLLGCPKNCKEEKHFYTACGNVNYCSCYRCQYGYSSKSMKCP